MMIHANLYQNYTLQPRYDELKALSRVFGGLIVPRGLSWQYAALSAVPTYTIKGATYFDKVARFTRSYDTKTKLLTDLKLTVNNATGEIIDASQGLTLGEQYRYTINNHGFTANHIPQLFTTIQTSGVTLIITSIEGDYNFNSGHFRGVVDTKTIEAIWNEQ